MRVPKITFPLLLSGSALLCGALPSAAVSSPWAANPESRVRLITPWAVAPRDGELRLGLHFKLAPGWHVYWKNSGDAGYAPVVVFAKTPGLADAELLWPAPERFELRGGLVAFGYASEVVYPVRATLSRAPGDRLQLSVDADYLVCEVDCVPYRYTLAVDQPLGGRPVPDPETSPLVAAWWDRLPVSEPPGVATRGHLEPGAPPILEIRVQGAEAAGDSQVFLETQPDFDTGKPQSERTPGGLVFRVPLKPHQTGKPLPQASTFAWTVTGLAHGGKAFSLEARQAVPLQAAAPVSRAAQTPARLQLDPALVALLAVAALLAALWLWGVRAGQSAAPRPAREGLGFAAAALLVLALWSMSRQVSVVGLAGIELALLAMALFSWLRSLAGSRRILSLLLALGVVACAATAPWLAHRNRLSQSSALSSDRSDRSDGSD